MDPICAIGAVASIAQLAQTAISLSRSLYGVGSAVASASEDIQELADDLKTFAQSLGLLARLLEDSKSWYSDDVYLLTARIIKDCAELYVKIDRILVKLRANGKSTWKMRVKFVYKEGEIRKLMKRLRDMKGTLATVLMSLQVDLQLSLLNISSASKLQRAPQQPLLPETVEQLKRAQLAFETIGNLSIQAFSDQNPVQYSEKEAIFRHWTSTKQDTSITSIDNQRKFQVSPAVPDSLQPAEPPPSVTRSRELDTAEWSQLHTRNLIVQPTDMTAFEPPASLKTKSPKSSSSSESFRSAVSALDEDNVDTELRDKPIQTIVHAFQTASEVLRNLMEKRITKGDEDLFWAAANLGASLNDGKTTIEQLHEENCKIYGSMYIQRTSNLVTLSKLNGIGVTLMNELVTNLHVLSAPFEELRHSHLTKLYFCSEKCRKHALAEINVVVSKLSAPMADSRPALFASRPSQLQDSSDSWEFNAVKSGRPVDDVDGNQFHRPGRSRSRCQETTIIKHQEPTTKPDPPTPKWWGNWRRKGRLLTQRENMRRHGRTNQTYDLPDYTAPSLLNASIHSPALTLHSASLSPHRRPVYEHQAARPTPPQQQHQSDVLHNTTAGITSYSLAYPPQPQSSARVYNSDTLGQGETTLSESTIAESYTSYGSVAIPGDDRALMRLGYHPDFDEDEDDDDNEDDDDDDDIEHKDFLLMDEQEVDADELFRPWGRKQAVPSDLVSGPDTDQELQVRSSMCDRPQGGVLRSARSFCSSNASSDMCNAPGGQEEKLSLRARESHIISRASGADFPLHRSMPQNYSLDIPTSPPPHEAVQDRTPSAGSGLHAISKEGLWWQAYAQLKFSHPAVFQLLASEIEDRASIILGRSGDETICKQLSKLFLDLPNVAQNLSPEFQAIVELRSRIINVVTTVQEHLGLETATLAWTCIFAFLSILDVTIIVLPSILPTFTCWERLMAHLKGTYTHLLHVVSITARYAVMENLYQFSPSLKLRLEYRTALLNLCTDALRFFAAGFKLAHALKRLAWEGKKAVLDDKHASLADAEDAKAEMFLVNYMASEIYRKDEQCKNFSVVVDVEQESQSEEEDDDNDDDSRVEELQDEMTGITATPPAGDLLAN